VLPPRLLPLQHGWALAVGGPQAAAWRGLGEARAGAGPWGWSKASVPSPPPRRGEGCLSSRLGHLLDGMWPRF